jgi:hypothetical protein
MNDDFWVSNDEIDLCHTNVSYYKGQWMTGSFQYRIPKQEQIIQIRHGLPLKTETSLFSYTLETTTPKRAVTVHTIAKRSFLIHEPDHPPRMQIDIL